MLFSGKKIRDNIIIIICSDVTLQRESGGNWGRGQLTVLPLCGGIFFNIRDQDWIPHKVVTNDGFNQSKELTRLQMKTRARIMAIFLASTLTLKGLLG
jgi:hypothetical protein